MTDPNPDRRLLLSLAALAPALAATMIPTQASAAGTDPLVVIAELVSKPGQADALRDLMVPFVAGARKEPGCQHYTLLEDRTTPGRFLTYEIWTDDAALAAHMQTPELKAAGPKLATILAKPFTQIMLKTLSS